MSWTKKPCPGCKEIISEYPYRKADEVCLECKTLIEEARDYREKVKNHPTKELMRYTDVYHWYPAPENLLLWGGRKSFDDDSNWDLYRKAIRDLILSVAEPVPEHESEFGPRAGVGHYNLPPVLARPGDRGGLRRVALFSREFSEALSNLDLLIHKIVKEAYEAGFRRGRKALLQLAEGKSTMLDFEKEFTEFLDKEKKTLERLNRKWT